MNPRTSQSDPLQIVSVNTPGGGCIGMTLCPGKIDPSAMTGAWTRDLSTDLDAIIAWGASTLLTLVEQHELAEMQVERLGEVARSKGLAWHHLPIRDGWVPAPAFEAQWQRVGPGLCQSLSSGEALVVHCRGGLGRTGVLAARLLIELGETPRDALKRVREARPGAVETPAQRDFVLYTVARIGRT